MPKTELCFLLIVTMIPVAYFLGVWIGIAAGRQYADDFMAELIQRVASTSPLSQLETGMGPDIESVLSDPPSHPGAILREFYLEKQQIGIAAFARRIGISRKVVSGIVNGHRRISPEIAVLISKALPETSAEMWLNLQKIHDLFQAEQKLANVKIIPLPQS